MTVKVGVDDFLTNGHGTADDINALPRIELGRPRLAPEALHGLAGRIVEAVDPYCEADPVATLAHLLVFVGNLIGPGPHARVLFDEHPARLFVALVGDSSKGRKGLAASVPRRLLKLVDPDWTRGRISHGLSSGEGLIYHVRDERHEQQPIKEKGRIVGYEDVVVDAGETDKRLLIVEPELAVVLKRMAGETNSLSAVLREAWDSGNLSTLTKNAPLRATGAHVSVMAHVTEPELRAYLTETERANGFANRFLFIHARRSKECPTGDPPPSAALDPFVAELRAIRDFAASLGHHEMKRDDPAEETWEAVYHALSAPQPGLFGSIISRGEAQALRLSVLYAILDRSGVIRPPHLEAGFALWEYAEASAKRIFGDRLGFQAADVILINLRQRGPMTRTDISGLFKRNMPADRIDAALAALETAGHIRKTLRTTRGRAAEVWEAA